MKNLVNKIQIKLLEFFFSFLPKTKCSFFKYWLLSENDFAADFKKLELKQLFYFTLKDLMGFTSMLEIKWVNY